MNKALKRLVKIRDLNELAKVDQDKLLAFELREAATALGFFVGDIYADDVLDVGFSLFCIRK